MVPFYRFGRWFALVLLFMLWGVFTGFSFYRPVEQGKHPALAVQTVTPLPDGSIKHLVQPGENLWTISVAYGVYIEAIQRINKMPADKDTIYIGQLLVIPTRQPTPVTPSVIVSPTSPPIVNQVVASAAAFAATGTAVEGLSTRATLTPSQLPTLLPDRPIPQTGRDFSQSVLLVLILLAFIGLALVVFGLMTKR